MASQWEYIRVRSIASEMADKTNPREAIEEKWSTKLTELGKSGWELVSETICERGDSDKGTWMVELSGTMKRPGAPL